MNTASGQILPPPPPPPTPPIGPVYASNPQQQHAPQQYGPPSIYGPYHGPPPPWWYVTPPWYVPPPYLDRSGHYGPQPPHNTPYGQPSHSQQDQSPMPVVFNQLNVQLNVQLNADLTLTAHGEARDFGPRTSQSPLQSRTMLPLRARIQGRDPRHESAPHRGDQQRGSGGSNRGDGLSSRRRPTDDDRVDRASGRRHRDSSPDSW